MFTWFQSRRFRLVALPLIFITSLFVEAPAFGSFLSVAKNIHGGWITIVGKPTSNTKIQGVPNKTYVTDGEGYTTGIYSINFASAGMTCKLSLFLGYSQNLTTKAYGSLNGCTSNQNGTAIPVVCNVDLDHYPSQREFRGIGLCNSYQPGDHYNEIRLQVSGR